MVNGIPVKVANGKDVETLYIATFRKHPCLKDKSKEIMKLFVKVSSYSRLMELEQDRMDVAKTEEEVKAISEKMVSIRLEEQEVNDNLIDLCFDFIVSALIGAGYDRETAEAKAELVPFERVMDVLNASRIGAMSVLDFFTVKPAHQ